MSSEADSLRRSKRKKFHLDVVSMHLVHPERRRTQPDRLTPSPDLLTRRASSLSPSAQNSPEPSDEKSRRIRRIPARNASYVFDDSDDDECRRGLEGTNLCVKCPARFETRPGLANHFKLHFVCVAIPLSLNFCEELFSYGLTEKNVVELRSELYLMYCRLQDELRCETSSSTELCLTSSPPQLSPPATYSACLPRSHTDPGHLSTPISHPDTPTSCRRTPAPVPPMTPPPHLVRVMNSSAILNRAFHENPRNCIQCPYKAKTGDRMKNHMIGHQKRTGFQCPFCTFKSESAGFLKRHVEIHGQKEYAWPPIYIGVNTRKCTAGPIEKRVQSRSTMKVLFLRCALQHATVGSPMKWPCPVAGCKFFAAVVSQHVVHHLSSHIPPKFRRLPHHMCLRCGVCFARAGALRIHSIIRHTRRHSSKALQYFMRERVGYNYVRCFTKAKFEIEEDEEKYQPSDGAIKVTPVKIEAEDMLAQAVTLFANGTGSEMCLEDHMIVHSEPSSVMDTGTVPSRSQSADGIRKSGSNETATSDCQKPSTLDDSGASTEETLNSSTEVEVKPPCIDVKAPLSIKVEPSVVSLMRPTKEVLPVLKRDRQNEERHQCPDCPFVESDEMIFNLHREMHGGRTRAFACNLCNYSCFAPETLHWHLSLHLPSLSPASVIAQRFLISILVFISKSSLFSENEV
ncbi:hypothetical protein GCK32_011476 [Trichostrongylus colubriformis]|uniref:C2H2-type domain-containing protein n=1 Tax=Trichostrongylus colubriformis TaxID=6319 RepID=A0AAN8FXT6_TRICO